MLRVEVSPGENRIRARLRQRQMRQRQPSASSPRLLHGEEIILDCSNARARLIQADQHGWRQCRRRVALVGCAYGAVIVNPDHDRDCGSEALHPPGNAPEVFLKGADVNGCGHGKLRWNSGRIRVGGRKISQERSGRLSATRWAWPRALVSMRVLRTARAASQVPANAVLPVGTEDSREGVAPGLQGRTILS